MINYVLPFVIALVIYVECKLLTWYDRTHPITIKENADA